MDLTGVSDGDISQSSGTDTFFSPMSAASVKRESATNKIKDDGSSVASEEVAIEVDSRLVSNFHLTKTRKLFFHFDLIALLVVKRTPGNREKPDLLQSGLRPVPQINQPAPPPMMKILLTTAKTKKSYLPPHLSGLPVAPEELRPNDEHPY